MAKQKKLLVKIIAALLLFVAAIFGDDLKNRPRQFCFC